MASLQLFLSALAARPKVPASAVGAGRVRLDVALCPIPQEADHVLEAQGQVRIGDATANSRSGDVVVIILGQRHKVWQRGEDDLVMLVT